MIGKGRGGGVPLESPTYVIHSVAQSQLTNQAGIWTEGETKPGIRASSDSLSVPYLLGTSRKHSRAGGGG